MRYAVVFGGVRVKDIFSFAWKICQISHKQHFHVFDLNSSHVSFQTPNFPTTMHKDFVLIFSHSISHTGIHYIGEMTGTTISKVLIDQLTDGQLQWNPIDDNFDTIAIGKSGQHKLYPLYAGSRQIFRDSIVKLFPEEEAAIDKYMKLLKVSHWREQPFFYWVWGTQGRRSQGLFLIILEKGCKVRFK